MRLSALGLIVSTLLFTIGCGDSDIVQIKGKVLLNDKPLKEGQVTFVPDAKKGTEGQMSTGLIDENGEFTLYIGAEEGVLVGHHKIAVNCPFRINEGSSDTGETSSAGPKSRCPIPPKYFDVSTSGLTEEVKSDGQEITIKLTR